MLKTYISKPREIQAIQYTGDNFEEIKKFTNTACDLLGELSLYNPPDIYIDFGRYNDVVKYGDYLFKNTCGSVVIVSKDEFENIYEPKK